MSDEKTFYDSRDPYGEAEGPDAGEICGAPIVGSQQRDPVASRFCYRYPGHAGACLGWFDMWADRDAFEQPSAKDLADERFDVGEYRFAVEKLGPRRWWVYRYVPGRRRWPGAGEPIFGRLRDALERADQLNHRARMLAGLVHHRVPPYGLMNGQVRKDATEHLRRAELADSESGRPEGR